MLLWVLFAVLTAFAAVLILYPYWRTSAAHGTASRDDVTIYKQQLQEIDGELAAGLLGEDEAKAARIEISRRLIAAAEASERKPGQSAEPKPAGTPLVAYVVVTTLAMISLGVYVYAGEPDLPARPLASRTAEPPMTMQDYVQALERQVRKYPKDSGGWQALGHLYMRSARYADAIKVYQRMIELSGREPDNLANLAEAKMFAANGDMNAETRALLEAALARDDMHPKANFLVGMSEERAGKLAEAAERYKRLLSESDISDDNKAVLSKRVAAIEAEIKGTPQTAGEDKAAGGDQAPQGMMDAQTIDKAVSKLAERLKQDGSNLNGWLMLVRSYVALGRMDEAKQAVQDAKGNFKDNTEALGQIDALARSLGLPS